MQGREVTHYSLEPPNLLLRVGIQYVLYEWYGIWYTIWYMAEVPKVEGHNLPLGIFTGPFPIKQRGSVMGVPTALQWWQNLQMRF